MTRLFSQYHLWQLTAALLLCVGAKSVTLAASFPLPPPGTDIVGRVQVVISRAQDTLLDIARRYDLGFNEITEANPGVDPWLPGDNTRIVLPTQFILPAAPRRGIVLNLAAMRLYYYPVPKAGEHPVVITYPIGIGRMNWRSPLGATRVASKIANPVWHVPPSIRKERLMEREFVPASVAAGPDNPLGQFALQLAIPKYLIHGTDRPYGIGMRVSHGCIHLYPEDISRLFARVDVGTEVRFIDQPYLAGWLDGNLYFEAHQPLEEDRRTLASDLTPVVYTIMHVQQTERSHRSVDWDRAITVAKQARSLPIQVSNSTLSSTSE
jgi:L,D-transpeptidase ErfK/SrfK